MENSKASASQTSDSKASVASENLDSSASVYTLMHDFENLQVNDNSSFHETRTGFSSSAATGCLTRPQEHNPMPVPVPLYSQSLWAAHDCLSNEGEYFGSSNYLQNHLNSGVGGSASSFNFTSTISGNGAPLIPTPKWASQENPFENRTINASDQFSSVKDILLMAKDKYGSHRLRQELLFSRDSKLTALIFEMVYVFTLEVMTSQHGRFVFGKLLESCSQDQLQLITLKLTSQDEVFLNASADNYGASSINKLIRVLIAKSPWISHVMFTLGRLFKHLMVTNPGLSIILQCLDTIYSRKNDFIYQAALEHCLTLANHEQGCLSMNNFIDEMRGSRRKQILHLISRNAAFLARNPSGNFVVQRVLGLENPEYIETICFALRGHYVDLSLRQCGSYVIEKCLNYPNMVHYVVEDFLSSNQIVMVANNKYGNYVIQTALKETMRVNRDLHHRLVMQLQQHLSDLRVPYGSKVYNCIRRTRFQANNV